MKITNFEVKPQPLTPIIDPFIYMRMVQVFIFGGRLAPKRTTRGALIADGDLTNDLFELDLGSTEWKEHILAGAPSARCEHATCESRHGRFVVHGGYDGRQCLADAFIFDAYALQWRIMDAAPGRSAGPAARALHAIVCLKAPAKLPGATTSRYLVCFGGVGSNRANLPIDESLFTFLFAQREWVRPSVPSWRPVVRSGHYAFADTDNGMIVVGGDTKALAGVEKPAELLRLKDVITAADRSAATATSAAALRGITASIVADLRAKVGAEATQKTAVAPSADEAYGPEFQLSKWKHKVESLEAEARFLRETAEAHERELAYKDREITDLVNEMDDLRQAKRALSLTRRKAEEEAAERLRSTAEAEAAGKRAYDLSVASKQERKTLVEEKRRLEAQKERFEAMEATHLENLKARVANEKALVATQYRLEEARASCAALLRDKDELEQRLETERHEREREASMRERLQALLAEERSRVASLSAALAGYEARDHQEAMEREDEERRRAAAKVEAELGATMLGATQRSGSGGATKGTAPKKAPTKKDLIADEAAILREEVAQEKKKRSALETRVRALEQAAATHEHSVRAAQEELARAETLQVIPIPPPSFFLKKNIYTILHIFVCAYIYMHLTCDWFLISVHISYI
jgi:hypothetical protein